jgi:hypothetical protein
MLASVKFVEGGAAAKSAILLITVGGDKDFIGLRPLHLGHQQGRLRDPEAHSAVAVVVATASADFRGELSL